MRGAEGSAAPPTGRVTSGICCGAGEVSGSRRLRSSPLSLNDKGQDVCLFHAYSCTRKRSPIFSL